ncbi:uncharacterized protein [Diadema antillarum]|uniref:uncharacterized protein n=1 Tax=Diadema antillarum TaxID=105358 RepID=UPI003A8C39B5
MYVASPGRGVVSVGPCGQKQTGTKRSSPIRSSGPRPLGTPANDISVHLDRRMVFLGRRGGGASTRHGKSKSADMERRQRVTHHARNWSQIGANAEDQAFVALVSPQLHRRQDRCSLPSAVNDRTKNGRTSRGLGLLRSHTVAEFRTPKINLTGVVGERPRPNLPRSSTWCASSKLSSISTSSLPVISTTASGRADALLSASCDGLVDRVSALRSLANNPKFEISIVNGSPQVTRRRNSRQTDATVKAGQKKGDVIIKCSKYGYHARSNSPTYRRLIHAKEQMDVALCKRLLSVRRDLDGQKARENSAIDDGLRMNMDDNESEEWYMKMMKKEMEQEDQDSGIIDNMTTLNEEPVCGFEALDISTPRPHVHLKFDPKFLQSHINDWNILNLNVEEEEEKIRARRERASLKDSRRKRSQSPTYFQRPCEACFAEKPQIEKPRVEFLRTNKSRRVKFYRREKKEEDDDDNGSEAECLSNSDQSSQKVSESSQQLPNVVKPARKRRHSHAKNKLVKPSKPVPLHHLTHGNSDRTKVIDTEIEENGLTISENSEEGNEEVVAEEEEQEQEVESKHFSLPTLETHENARSPLPDIKSPPPVKEQQPEEKKDSSPDAPKLTDKEKFLLMRKRMEERQKERLQKRESFIDYSMIAFAGSRKDRAGRGEKGLGSTLSSRLDSMASFQSNQDAGERKGLLALVSSDDDDDDDDDDEESDDSDY